MIELTLWTIFAALVIVVAMSKKRISHKQCVAFEYVSLAIVAFYTIKLMRIVFA